MSLDVTFIDRVASVGCGSRGNSTQQQPGTCTLSLLGKLPAPVKCYEVQARTYALEWHPFILNFKHYLAVYILKILLDFCLFGSNSTNTYWVPATTKAPRYLSDVAEGMLEEKGACFISRPALSLTAAVRLYFLPHVWWCVMPPSLTFLNNDLCYWHSQVSPSTTFSPHRSSVVSSAV